MKRVLSLMLVTMLLVVSTCVVSASAGGTSLDDVVKKNETTQTQGAGAATAPVAPTPAPAPAPTPAPVTPTPTEVRPATEPVAPTPAPAPSTGASLDERNQAFIAGLNDAGNLTEADIAGAQSVMQGAKTVASFIVQVLSYFIIAFLAVRILLDLTFITIPFTRSFLANGYAGAPQNPAEGAAMGNGMGGGMGGMGMGGMGGMGGYGGGMGGGRYGRGGYGGGMGGGMGGMGGMPGGMNPAAGNQNTSMMGKIQWVSAAALNAVASESAVGPDGRSQNPFKIYSKDMVVVLIVTPILIIMASTGVVTNFSLIVGGFLVESIQKLGAMIG